MPTISFSDRKLKSLALPARTPGGAVHQVDYWDESFGGFGLRLSSSGARTWMLMTRVPNGNRTKQIRYKVGRYKVDKDGLGLTLAEARTRAAELRKLIESGVNPRRLDEEARKEQAEASQNTFATVRKEFLGRYCDRHLRANTAGQYAATLKRKEFESWEELPIAEITRKDVHRVLDAIADKAPIAANRTLAVLRKFMNWAVERGHIQIAPTTGVKAPEQERLRDRHLFGDPETGRPSELALAWRAFEGTGRYEPFFKLLFLTGQRRTEVAEMAWDELHDLDGENPRWVIPKGRTKNNKEHIVPLGPLAVEVIKSIPRVDDWRLMFTTTGKTPISAFSQGKARVNDNIKKLKAADAAGTYKGQFVDRWTIHDLRRSVYTGVLELGFSIDIADALTNHVSGSSRQGVRRNYNWARHEATKRTAVLAWEAHIRSLLEGDTGAKNVFPINPVVSAEAA